MIYYYKARTVRQQRRNELKTTRQRRKAQIIQHYIISMYRIPYVCIYVYTDMLQESFLW